MAITPGSATTSAAPPALKEQPSMIVRIWRTRIDQARAGEIPGLRPLKVAADVPRAAGIRRRVLRRTPRPARAFVARNLQPERGTGPVFSSSTFSSLYQV